MSCISKKLPRAQPAHGHGAVAVLWAHGCPSPAAGASEVLLAWAEPWVWAPAAYFRAHFFIFLVCSATVVLVLVGQSPVLTHREAAALSVCLAAGEGAVSSGTRPTHCFRRRG